MSSDALFRIKRKSVLEFTGSELTVGTRSTTDLVLDDPIVASHHATIFYREGLFYLQPYATATGIYLNGLLVQAEEPLRSGDRIVLGVSRIGITYPESEPGVLELDVDEQSFFFTKKKRQEFESDSDEWVRSEVDFGKLKGLGALNLGAAVLGLFLLAGVLFWPGRQAVLQPGPLAAVHAEHVASCADCHDPFHGVTVANCLQCHTELIEEGRHPFQDTPDALATVVPSCVVCHSEHHGPRNDLRRGSFGAQQGDCMSCHEGDSLFEQHLNEDEGRVEGELLARARMRSDIAAARRAPQPQQEGSYTWGAFSHERHGALDGTMECSVCHLSSEDPDFDFALPSFETACAACHGPEVARDTLQDWLGQGLVSADRIDKTNGTHTGWHLNWHGSGAPGDQAQCRMCHEETFEPQLRSVEVADRSGPPTFTLVSRSHVNLKDVEHGGGKKCSECHKVSDGLEGGRKLAARPFDHGVHLSSDPKLAAGQCAECHADVGAASGLTEHPEVYAVGGLAESCGGCHGGESSVTTASRVASQTMRQVADFPHVRHQAMSCLECHRLEPGVGSGVLTTPRGLDCRGCHYRDGEHREIGFLGELGKEQHCGMCHPAQDGRPHEVFLGGHQGVARASSGFRHDENHGFLPDENPPDCRACHVSSSTEGGDFFLARDIRSTQETCIECHAAQRFHWR